MTSDSSSFAPLVLLIEDQEWTARSIESILVPHGYAVPKAYTGQRGIDVAHRLIPDLVLVGMHLPDMTGAAVLRELAKTPTVTPATPLVLLTTGPLAPKDRREAFEAGAWEVLRPPFDSQELAVRFGTWIRAKREADGANDRGLVDPETGVYNFNGLLKRSQELVSDAARHERDLAFVMFGFDEPEEEEEVEEGGPVTALGALLQEVCRVSDAIARIGDRDFVVLAPGTDEEGATHLARRVMDSARASRVHVRAGISAARGRKEEPFVAVDLLGRATEALRRAQSGSDGGIETNRLN